MDMDTIIGWMITIGLCVVLPVSCVMDDYYKHQEKMICMEKQMTAEQCKEWRDK